MYEDIEGNGVCEDIHIEDYDKRRHCVKTMEREDLVVSLFPFLLCWVIGTTAVKCGPSEQSQSDWSDAQPNPMSSSKDNERKSYPESDELALLVAQVKLPRVFEIWPLGHVSIP